jgi:hypothetical protein
VNAAAGNKGQALLKQFIEEIGLLGNQPARSGISHRKEEDRNDFRG